jgi:hypothetical protein
VIFIKDFVPLRTTESTSGEMPKSKLPV